MCASPSFQRATPLRGTRPEYRNCPVRVKQFRSSDAAVIDQSQASLGGYDRRDLSQGTLLPDNGEPEYYDRAATGVKGRPAPSGVPHEQRPGRRPSAFGEGPWVSERSCCPDLGGECVSRLALGCPVSLAGARPGLAWCRGHRAARARAGPAPPQLVSQTPSPRRTKSSSISSTRRLIVRVTSLPRSRP